jgi:hypothetical protein
MTLVPLSVLYIDAHCDDAQIVSIGPIIKMPELCRCAHGRFGLSIMVS